MLIERTAVTTQSPIQLVLPRYGITPAAMQERHDTCDSIKVKMPGQGISEVSTGSTLTHTLYSSVTPDSSKGSYRCHWYGMQTTRTGIAAQIRSS